MPRRRLNHHHGVDRRRFLLASLAEAFARPLATQSAGRGFSQRRPFGPRESLSDHDIELVFGIACLRRYCGPEPSGASLEIIWPDHDSGSYATMSLVWEQGFLVEEYRDYIERCRKALDQLDDCMDWDVLRP